MPTWPTAAQVIQVAKSQIGTTENPPGSNHTKYNAAYGAYSQGWAWCGIFQWWCFAQAGIDLRKDGGIPDPQFTPSFFAEAKAAGWVVPADENIRPGDVLFFDFVPPFNTAGIQHVALATTVPDHGTVHTIEGNTSSGNSGSQDNGGGVFARARSLDVIVAAVRPPYGTEDDMPTLDEISKLLDAKLGKVPGDVWGFPVGSEVEPDGKTHTTQAIAAQRNYDRLKVIAGLTPDAIAAAIVAQFKTLPAGTATVDDATIAKVAQATATELATRLVR
jgi:hypothetical protein